MYRKRVRSSSQARLTVTPFMVGALNFPHSLSGGSRRRSGLSVVRTDDLIEQRPYVPGDDPRRINWKLLGHAGGLFVREEDREPPPHTHLVLLICTNAAHPFYRRRGEAASGVDVLCEAGFCLAEEALQSGVQVLFGGSGIELRALDEKNAAECFALPWASDSPLPVISAQDKEVTVLAMPPGLNAISPLDSFLERAHPNLKINIFFMFNDERLAGAAHAAALQYRQRAGVYARAVEFK